MTRAPEEGVELYSAAGVRVLVACEPALAEAGRVWPLTVALADFVVAQRGTPPHATKLLVELGAGTGALACLLAQALPRADFVMTDLPHVLPQLQRTVELNGLCERVSVRALPWGEPVPAALGGASAVLLCECLYWGGWSLLDADTRAPLRSTLRQLCGSDTDLFLAFTIRDTERELGVIRALLDEDGFEVWASAGVDWVSAVEGDTVVLALRRTVDDGCVQYAMS